MQNLERRYHETDSDWTRQEIEQYMVIKICPKCHGKRLKPEILAVKIFKAVRWAARKTPFGDYHIHHSTLGLLLVLLGILTPITLIKVTLVGFGLGMFTHHTQTEGLIFVTKYKKDSYHKIVKHP